MKIGRLNITYNSKPKAVARAGLSERYRAQYDKGASGKPVRKVFHQGENTWQARCKHYDDLMNEQPLAKQGLLTLAGLCVAQGVFTKPSETKPKRDEQAAVDAETGLKQVKEAKFQAYGMAVDAQFFVDKFNRKQRVNSKFCETILRMVKYGGCFWEITSAPEWSFRIAPMQEFIEPAEADAQGKITRWRQIVNGTTQAEWTGEELVLVPGLNQTTATWPWASSLLSGLETELEALVAMESSAKDYMEKQAWPYEVLQLGDSTSNVSDDDFDSARNEWRNRQPGEGIVTNVPTQILPGGTGSSPIRELATLCELLKDNVGDGIMVPGISKLYNSTEASAKVMTSHVMSSLGQPLQWIVKEYYEEYILKPMLEASGFSRKSCPEITFESPDTNKKEEGEYWTSLVNAKIQTPMQAAEHLGLEYDQAYWDQQLKMEQEKFEQQLQMKADNAPKDANPEKPKHIGLFNNIL